MKIIHRELDRFDNIEIYPLSDVHIEDNLHDNKRLYKWRKEVLEQPNRFVILNGDLINMATRHSVSDVYAATMTPGKAIQKTIEFLQPIKDRILAATTGNHEFRAYKDDGIDIMELAMIALFGEEKTKEIYSPGAYILYLSFGRSQYRDCRKMIYSIYSKHGAGGGRKIGAKAIRLLEMQETIDADIYIHSHTHVPFVTRSKFFRCDYRNRQVTEVEHLFVNTNAFLNFGGYGEEKGFSPTSTKYPKIILNGIEREMQAVI